MNNNLQWVKLAEQFPPEEKIVWTRKTFEEKGKKNVIEEHMIFRNGKMYVSDFSIRMYYLPDEWAYIN